MVITACKEQNGKQDAPEQEHPLPFHDRLLRNLVPAHRFACEALWPAYNFPVDWMQPAMKGCELNVSKVLIVEADRR